MADPGNRRRLFYFLAAIAFTVLLFNLSLLSGTDQKSNIKKVPTSIPENKISHPQTGKNASEETISDPLSTLSHPLTADEHHGQPLPELHQENQESKEHAIVQENHPIAKLMQQADNAWHKIEELRSKTFKEAVTKYRTTYGRNPPPGFNHWYKFARERNAYNMDDFGQIMDDLRPFWGIEPKVIRALAANLHKDEAHGISGLHIRKGEIWKLTNSDWRAETMEKMLQPFVKYLPDMDIAMNRLDQPRVVVPWDDMQALLKAEATGRQIYPEATSQWTKDMTGLYSENNTDSLAAEPIFFEASGKQYMLIASEACPPESRARGNRDFEAAAQFAFRERLGGFVTNFNISSNLCQAGPEIQEKHGFLFAPSNIVASRQLLPIFGEYKVNVNSDILFPANLYYRDDDRYAYDPTFDVDWEDKHDVMIWRGVTSGGTNTADNWKDMHRQRLALKTNATVMAHAYAKLLKEDIAEDGTYVNFDYFRPSDFAINHTDVGFTAPFACVPNCDFYNGIWTYKNMTTLSEQFKSKYVIDIDGYSYSGRWYAFLHSKSLGLKSTIFREWHDSRLIPWRHFVPVDHRYEELYSILTYFIGLGDAATSKLRNTPYMTRHDSEAKKLGAQGREWAAKVLRHEDMEIYTFRLLLEYARIIDDNRDRIGYSGDGSEFDF